MAHLAMDSHRQDVCASDRVSMRHKTASRATVDPPLGFGTVAARRPIRQAPRTRLCGRRFLFKRNSYPCCRCLVCEIDPLASMRPDPNFLLALGVQTLAVSYVSDISDHQGTYTTLFGPIYHRASDFVFQIVGASALFGLKAILAALQLLPAAGAFFSRSCLARNSETRLAVYCAFERSARHEIMQVSLPSVMAAG